MKPAIDRSAALRELRALVATYLEDSDDAPRAADLLDALEAPNLPSMLSDTFWGKLKESIQELADKPTTDQENRQRKMFGCTTAAIDEALARKDPRDIAMYAMSTLSNAQEMIQRKHDEDEGTIEWSVADRHANTIRQLMNIAKYAIDKAVPR
jgi:hypothetical protein